MHKTKKNINVKSCKVESGELQPIHGKTLTI